jgi:hypothetical protein
LDRHRQEQALLWQTRTLATYIAATVPVESKNDTNQLLEMAQRIGLSEEQHAALTATAPETKTPTSKEPTAGSFEAFMGSFGNPNRWR